MSRSISYEQCAVCRTEWQSQAAFLTDPSLRLDGYQACFQQADAGLFLFTHMREDCHSTLALPVKDFEHLYTGPRHTHYLTGNGECPLYCLDNANFRICPNPCAMAWVRYLLTDLRSAREGCVTCRD